MLWAAHKVIMQHHIEEGFQWWQITLPGHPVEVARTGRNTDITMQEAKAFLSRVIGIEEGDITRLYDQSENILGFMYTLKGIPLGFLMKLKSESKAQKIA